MTVATEVRSVEYLGDGVTKDFSIPFEYLNKTHIKVTFYPVSGPSSVLTLGLNPGYGDVSGGGVKDVYFPVASTPCPIGSTLRIERVVPVTQDVNLSNQGTYDAETQEEMHDLGVMVDQQLLDRIKALESAGAPGSVIAGDGLVFDGDGVTLHAVVDGDTVMIEGDTIKLRRVYDTQHGTRGGGTLHANAVSGGAAGFQSGTDKQRQDALWGRTITAGAGLVGGGDLSANRTIDVGAGDASIVVAADSISVGVINDAQHGARAGGTAHAVASTTTAGFMSAADKTKLDGLAAGDTLEAAGPTIKTADVTVTTILSWTPDNNSVEHIEAQVVGLTAVAAKAAGYKLVGTVRRADGTTSLVGSTVIDTQKTTAAWDCVLDVSSPEVRVRVTGEAATTILWSVIVRRRRLAYT